MFLIILILLTNNFVQEIFVVKRELQDCSLEFSVIFSAGCMRDFDK